MIVIHEGVPGSGKSYDAVRKVLDALKLGRVVVTNIDGLNTEKCRDYISKKAGIPPFVLSQQLYHLENKNVAGYFVPEPDSTVDAATPDKPLDKPVTAWDHSGAFIVIDEAQLYFNSRDYAKDNNRKICDWASTHRHHGFDLLLITQRAERIDTGVRSLAEFRYRYRKLNVFGNLVNKSYLVYTHAGEDPKHLAMRKMTYDVSIFPCYQSYVGDATEKKIIRLPNLLNHPIFYALAVVLVAVFYFGSSSPLLRGQLIDTPKLDAHKAAVASSGKQPLKLSRVADPAEQDPAHAGKAPPEQLPRGGGPPTVEEISDTSGLVVLGLDAIVQTSSGRVFMSSNGVSLYQWVRYDSDLMTVWLLPEQVPHALRQSAGVHRDI